MSNWLGRRGRRGRQQHPQPATPTPQTPAQTRRTLATDPAGKTPIGWWLDHALPKNKEDPGQALGRIIDQAVGLQPDEVYRHAFDRWHRETTAEPGRFAAWQGELTGRLLARGEPNLAGASVSLHATYGLPMLRGSQLKGLVLEHILSGPGWDALAAIPAILQPDVDPASRDDDEEIRALIDILLGSTDNAGFLVFHDAWWVPDSAGSPLAAEVRTPHHAEYYQSSGARPPSDREPPNPCPWLAVQGAFWFVIEGVRPWSNWGQQLVQSVLASDGAGGGRHADLGRFRADSET